jgi:glycosyltransferase involved in cell wall biosynthesis
VIVGPDEDGYAGKIKELCKELRVEERVKFVGPVSDVEKWQQYVDADLFVLPSFSENFGMSIAEAMASGLPVITTTGTPWQVLRDQQLGWWIEPTVEALSDALMQATSIGELRLKRMGSDARAFVRSAFDWPSAASTLIDYYRRLCTQR